ncbi:MAG TPA: lysophospholipid acyltransferase family protein [Kiritimatiellia bacterium]|jgi:1-acyl-sn-glycerol-3-phosphate acyltransferase
MTEHSHNPFMFKLSRGLIHIWMTFWLRLEIRNSDLVPEEGGCLIAANHVSYLDPPMIACAVNNRFVRFLARDTLFRFRGFGSWLTAVGVMPLSRDRGDVGALRKSIQMLKEGMCLCLFPEGTRSLDGELQEAKGGIGFLVAKAHVPVVPVYISGTYKAYPRGAKWVRPAKCIVTFGPPISAAEFEALGPERDAYDKIGKLIMERIRALRG